MPELRWTLLILGVLFLAVLTWWELRRQRQSSRGGMSAPSHRAGEAGPTSPPRVLREPSISLPEIRAPSQSLPVVEVDDEPTATVWIEPERMTAEPEQPEESENPEPPAPPAPATSPSDSEPATPPQRPVVRGATVVPPVPPPPEPIVEWPEESARRILALRLVAPPQERFAGHAVRQALAAEGFVLGKFSIFHKPGPDARAVVSAASLTKPGTFDAETMDSQRFSGLSLFAVLPGPLPPVQAFDELLATARGLNTRLEGALQDERGQPLTPTRSAAIRQGLMQESQPETPPEAPS